jgi:hypothetical protein
LSKITCKNVSGVDVRRAAEAKRFEKCLKIQFLLKITFKNGSGVDVHRAAKAKGYFKNALKYNFC